MIAQPEPWTVDALCAQVDPEAWFPENGSGQPAKRICRNCPVIAECLEYSLRIDARHGIWGGKSERERRGMRPKQAHRIAGRTYIAETITTIGEIL